MHYVNAPLENSTNYTMKDKFIFFIVEYLAGMILRILRRTLRFRLIGKDYFNEVLNRGEGCIAAFWHGDIMISMLYNINKGYNALVSKSKDGEIIARILNGYGYKTIRGSTGKIDKRALVGMLRVLKKKELVGITPDGPHGPYRKLQPGAVSIARKSGCPIVPLAVSANRKKIFKSWDRFLLPLPFSECYVLYGEPIYIKNSGNKDTDSDDIKMVEEIILSNNKKAADYCTQERLRSICGRNIFANRYFSFCLTPFSYIYGGVLGIREYFYGKNIFKQNALSRCVISVGNITLGGTGKTPLTMYIAKLLTKRGLKAVTLTRGYKSKSTKSPAVLDKKSEDAEKYGDEPLIMQKKIPDVPVIIGRKRYRSGLLAQEQFGPDVFILDDGYQHRELRRDINILLLNGNEPFGTGRLFPAGNLREPLSGIKRADVVVISKSGEVPQEVIERIRTYTQAPVFYMNYRVSGLRSFDGEYSINVSEISSLKAAAFGGIADHESFLETLWGSGMEVLDYRKYRDHHYYTEKDIKSIISTYRKLKADIIVTTGKDAVKIPPHLRKPFPFFYVDIRVEMDDSKQFEEYIMSIVKEHIIR